MQPKEGIVFVLNLDRSGQLTKCCLRRAVVNGRMPVPSTRPSPASVSSPGYVAAPPSDCFLLLSQPGAQTARPRAGCHDRPRRRDVHDALRLFGVFLYLQRDVVTPASCSSPTTRTQVLDSRTAELLEFTTGLPSFRSLVAHMADKYISYSV
jgi:hypothetical protein